MSMKQITIFLSADLEEQMITALESAGAEGFFRLEGGLGNRFLEPGAVPRLVSWEAVVIIVPEASEEVAESLVEAARKFKGSCEVEPCLRLTVSPVERSL